MNWLLAVITLALASAQTGKNLFLSGNYYVNPSYDAELQTSINNSTGITQQNLMAMQSVASAYWLDVKAKLLGTNTSTAQGILADAAKKNPIPLVVFIVYDLPNRDCNAKASNGEICCYYNSDGTCNYQQSGDCSAGIADYETNYTNVLYSVLAQYPQVPVVLIIEPDSLPNLATNQDNPACGNSATETAYKTGIPYAVNKYSTLSNVVQYVDAAHGGWLGWLNNMDMFVDIVTSLNINSKIRGFATNTANYQPLGVPCPLYGNGQPYCLQQPHPTATCCIDPCNLNAQYNPCNNEANYVTWLQYTFQQRSGGFAPRFIIDTGRNGVTNMRSNCANWCNIRGAGVGLIPTYMTFNQSLVDAYYWLKTPGESDGCTQTLPDPNNPDDPNDPGLPCSRYDSMCGSVDSIGSQPGEPYAPVAGNWFDYEVKQLATNQQMGENKPTV